MLHFRAIGKFAGQIRTAPKGTVRLMQTVVLVLSDECKPVSVWQCQQLLCRAKFTPLGQSGSAVQLKIGS
jgi:hypothetical protein